MGMNLARQTFSTAPNYFIAGANIGITTAVKEAGTDIPEHTPVLLADGSAIASADALEGLYGVSADSAEAGKDTVIYLTGEFFANGLVLPEGVTAANVETALRKIGIFFEVRRIKDYAERD